MPEPTTSASQLDAIEANDPTKAELQDCANARAEVLAANTNLQTVVTLLTTPKPSTPTTTVKKSSSSSSSSSSNARAVASAKADLLQAEQDLQAANDDLDAATLVAPISGTVGVVGLTKGDSASSGTITIVGSGNAVVTIELPLKTRSLVTVGQEVTVTPAGSTTAMKGKLTAISTLETSGTSGTTTTYATTVAVSDADQLLATGAKASVAIAVKSASGVIRVPASAVTPTGTGTATVQVVASATADTTTSVTVKTGTVGGGWVEITEGLEAGKLVVLADRTADIPTNATRRRTTTTSTSSSSASASASATAQPTSGASTPASAQPTASASEVAPPGTRGHPPDSETERCPRNFGELRRGVVAEGGPGREPVWISPWGSSAGSLTGRGGDPAPRQGAPELPVACHRSGRCLPIEPRHGGHPQGPERVRTISFAGESRPATGTAASCAVPTR